jgi:DNA polymerase-3 subunit delta'
LHTSDYNNLSWNSNIRGQLLGRGLAQLPHAMLLVGPPGVGKAGISEQLAALLLCESKAADLSACGNVRRVAGWKPATIQTSGGLRRKATTKRRRGCQRKGQLKRARKRNSSMIKIDQIRELESFVFVGSHREGNRVVLITEADAMNQPAANSLLKILEEPPSSVYFILSFIKSEIAPADPIRSRCRTVPFGAPDAAEATAWLARSGLENRRHATSISPPVHRCELPSGKSRASWRRSTRWWIP